MRIRSLRPLAVAGAALALAVPGTALAHGGHAHGVNCRAIAAGHAPKKLSDDQVKALAAACATRDAAVKAANDAYVAATKPAYDAYRATAESVRADLRSAKQARRAACKPDPSAQACKDARASYHATVRSLRAKLREAKRTLHEAVRGSRQTWRASIKAAEAAFLAQVAQILQSS